MMTGKQTSAFALALALALACNKEPQVPLSPEKEQAAQASPTPAPDPSKQEAPRPDPENKPDQPVAIETDNPYINLGNPDEPDGPPFPPVGDLENLVPADLNDWNQLSIERVYDANPVVYPTPLDAQLDRDALNNQGKAVFHFVMQGDLETAMRKYPLDEVAYIDLLQLTGKAYEAQLYAEYREAVANRMHELGATYGKFVEATGRQDKLLNVEYRAARWYFKYENTSGKQIEACYLFLLSRNAWRVLDLDCTMDF